MSSRGKPPRRRTSSTTARAAKDGDTDAALLHEHFYSDPRVECCHSFTLCTFEDLPRWLADNKNIAGHYRKNFTPWLALKSVFRWHNESLNIWSHLVGTLMAVWLLWVLWSDPQRFFLWFDEDAQARAPKFAVTSGDMFIFTVFLVGLMVQMFNSTVFHIFCCVSPQWFLFTARMDYSGIAFMIVGSYYAPIAYSASCHVYLGPVYIAIITLLGFVCANMALNPHFSTPRLRAYKMWMFIIFAFFGAVPIPHHVYHVGWAPVVPVLWRELAMGSVYLLGCFFYSTHFPESRWPHRFDLCHSHVFWHVCVLVAGLIQLYVSLWCFRHRQTLCPPLLLSQPLP